MNEIKFASVLRNKGFTDMELSKSATIFKTSQDIDVDIMGTAYGSTWIIEAKGFALPDSIQMLKYKNYAEQIGANVDIMINKKLTDTRWLCKMFIEGYQYLTPKGQIYTFTSGGKVFRPDKLEDCLNRSLAIKLLQW